MYTNSYQSGSSIELFNSQSKELAKNWKFSGQILKDYDQLLKNYTTNLINGGTSKIQIPPNDKVTLGIVQGYVVFQIYVFSLKSLTIEIFISDTSKTRRRLIFSSSTKEIVVNSMHSRIPLLNVTTNTWINVSIDVISFASECFKSQTFRSIEFISITGSCKIKKVFSMRNPLINNPPDKDESVKEIEAQLKIIGLPAKLIFDNINLNYEKVKNFIDTELVNKCSQIMNKSPNTGGTVSSNNYTNPLKGNNIVVITNKRSPLVEKTQQPKRSVNANADKVANKVKNVVFVSRREIKEIEKKETAFRSKSNNPIKRPQKEKISNKSKESSLEKSSSINRNHLSTDNHSKEQNNQVIEVNIIDPNVIEDNLQTNNHSIKKNNFTLQGSLKSNKSISRKGHSLEKSIKNIYLNSPYYQKSIKNTEHEESIEELYDHEEFKNYQEEEQLQNEEKHVDIMKFHQNKEINERNNFLNLNQNLMKKEELSRTDLSKNVSQLTNYNPEKYYDIPIIDNKGRSTFKRTEDTFALEMKMKENLSKKRLLDDMLNEESEGLEISFKNDDRPYTPPITKLVNANSLKTVEETNMLRESKSRILEKLGKDPEYSKKISYDIGNDQYLDLVYDPVIGFYFDPKSNVYYELKNS